MGRLPPWGCDNSNNSSTISRRRLHRRPILNNTDCKSNIAAEQSILSILVAAPIAKVVHMIHHHHPLVVKEAMQ